MQCVEQNGADYEIYFWNKNMHLQHTFSPAIRLSMASHLCLIFNSLITTGFT